MNYTFLTTSDVHLGWKLYNLPELAEDLKEMFVKFVDKAIELNVDYVIIVGDLFDINRPPPDLISFVKDQVNRLSRNHIMALGIAGDHDKPVNGSTWVTLSDLSHINEHHLGGRLLGFDYTDNSPATVEILKDYPKADKVEWIFLHGQVPELFTFVQEKKLLNLRDVDFIGKYPKLKGIILGDIHTPYEGVISDPSKMRPDIFIGYCGSLGVVKSDEAWSKRTGVLYYDGSTLKRELIPLDRLYIKNKIEVLTDPKEGLIDKYKIKFKDEKKKPVLVVEYDRSTAHLLPQVQQLSELAIIREARKATIDKDKPQETINIRSELKTKDRIEQVLKSECAGDTELFNLAYSLIMDDDPKSVLDKFKEASFSS